jgi:hypothetical protein
MRRLLRAAARESGLAEALAAPHPVIGVHVRHGDACLAAETARTARSCEPLSAYISAVQGYATALGARHIFLATDSDQVRRGHT